MPSDSASGGIGHEWVARTKVANSHREFQELLDERCVVRTVRGDIGRVVDPLMEDDTIVCQFDVDDRGPVPISTIEDVKRRPDHSGRKPDDLDGMEAVEQVMNDALGDDYPGDQDAR